MLATDEDALVCDLAETYHIYNFRQLPALQVAVFAYGLRDDARIKLALAGQKVPLDTLLLAGVHDRLSYLVWAKTKDGQTGRNRPVSLAEALLEVRKEKGELAFRSGEDFERARALLMGGGKVDG